MSPHIIYRIDPSLVEEWRLIDRGRRRQRNFGYLLILIGSIAMGALLGTS